MTRVAGRLGVALAVVAASLAAPEAASGAGDGSRPSIVQLGDSVASGEGTLYGYRYDRATRKWVGGDLDAKWPKPYPACHHSPDAYGAVAARRLGTRFEQLACSGASFLNGISAPQTTSRFLGTSTVRPAQFGNWATQTDLDPSYDRARPDLVLVTFGADDVDFETIVRDCVLNGYAYALGLASLECVATNRASQ